jgi:hypothetical protein
VDLPNVGVKYDLRHVHFAHASTVCTSDVFDALNVQHFAKFLLAKGRPDNSILAGMDANLNGHACLDAASGDFRGVHGVLLFVDGTNIRKLSTGATPGRYLDGI